MSIPEALPAYSVSLVTMLDAEFPHRCPRKGEDAESVQRYAGKRELIDLLLQRFEGSDNEERVITEAMNWIEGDA